jgi:hypothetical protein
MFACVVNQRESSTRFSEEHDDFAGICWRSHSKRPEHTVVVERRDEKYVRRVAKQMTQRSTGMQSFVVRAPGRRVLQYSHVLVFKVKSIWKQHTAQA